MAKIRQLPTAPSSSRPLSFNEDADAFVIALEGFVGDANALASDVESIAKKAEKAGKDISAKSDEAAQKHSEIVAQIAGFVEKYTDFEKRYDQIRQAHQDIDTSKTQIAGIAQEVRQAKEHVDSTIEAALKKIANIAKAKGFIDDSDESIATTWSSKKIKELIEKKTWDIDTKDLLKKDEAEKIYAKTADLPNFDEFAKSADVPDVSGLISKTKADELYQPKTDLAAVATSGSYNDLKDKPEISGGGLSKKDADKAYAAKSIQTTVEAATDKATPNTLIKRNKDGDIEARLATLEHLRLNHEGVSGTAPNPNLYKMMVQIDESNVVLPATLEFVKSLLGTSSGGGGGSGGGAIKEVKVFSDGGYIEFFNGLLVQWAQKDYLNFFNNDYARVVYPKPFKQRVIFLFGSPYTEGESAYDNTYAVGGKNVFWAGKNDLNSCRFYARCFENSNAVVSKTTTPLNSAQISASILAIGI